MTKAQKRAAHMRKGAWSPAARAKRAATYAAKRNGLLKATKSSGDTKDILVFLEHAERAILKSGSKRITAAESYAMLALTTLREST